MIRIEENEKSRGTVAVAFKATARFRTAGLAAAERFVADAFSRAASMPAIAPAPGVPQPKPKLALVRPRAVPYESMERAFSWLTGGPAPNAVWADEFGATDEWLASAETAVACVPDFRDPEDALSLLSLLRSDDDGSRTLSATVSPGPEPLPRGREKWGLDARNIIWSDRACGAWELLGVTPERAAECAEQAWTDGRPDWGSEFEELAGALENRIRLGWRVSP